MAVNIASINNKLSRAFKSSGVKSKLTEYNEDTIKEAADVFIGILKNQIDSSGLRSNVAAEINSLERDSSPTKLEEDKYSIGIGFSEDMARASLNPSDELHNLAFLLNDGYGHTRHALRGIWVSLSRGEAIPIVGLRERGGEHFIENAIKEFMDNYADQYGVIDIVVNRDGE